MIYSEEQAAGWLACSVDTVREMAADGRLPGLKPGRSWVFPAAAFEEAVNRLASDAAAGRRQERESRAAAIAMTGLRKAGVMHRVPPALPEPSAPQGPRP